MVSDFGELSVCKPRSQKEKLDCPCQRLCLTAESPESLQLAKLEIGGVNVSFRSTPALVDIVDGVTRGGSSI